MANDTKLLVRFIRAHPAREDVQALMRGLAKYCGYDKNTTVADNVRDLELDKAAFVLGLHVASN